MAGFGKRPLRPFPALDPEPTRREAWRRRRWPAAGCAAAAAVAVALGLTAPWSALSSPGSPARPPAPARFADAGGTVVYDAPSGVLGTAAPDGSRPVTLTGTGGLQGSDLPVDSGGYAVNLEGQLVSARPDRPGSVRVLPGSAAQQQFGEWATESFADGGRYVAATACVAEPHAGQSWAAQLFTVPGGQALPTLGAVTDAAGDPASIGVFAALPASPDAVYATYICVDPGSVPDTGIDLLRPGAAPHQVISAGALARAVGWPPGTPVSLAIEPSPDGRRLAVTVSLALQTPRPGTPSYVVILTRNGTVLGQRELPARTGVARWSPDGNQIAFGQAARGLPSEVTVWTVGAASRTIALVGHHDAGCTQLLWSPGGSQLLYAAAVTTAGLDRADDLQHGWTVIDLKTGQSRDVRAPGQPVAWLPGPGLAGSGTGAAS